MPPVCVKGDKMGLRSGTSLILALTSVFFSAGCGSGSSSSSSAQVRLIDASPEQTDLNLLLDNNSVQSGVVYNSATAYASEPAGSHTALIEQAGSNTSLVTQTISLNAGASYTALAVETSFNSSTLGMILLTDDNTPPSSGKVKLRIVNATPDLGNFDAYIVAPGTDITTQTPAIGNLAFQSASAYQTVAAGNYEVYITLHDQSTVQVDSGPLVFSSGQIRTVVILDNVGGGDTASLFPDLN